MKRTFSEDKADVAERVQRHRGLLRDAGLRPVQFWVTDTRRAGFAAECRRQCVSLRQGTVGRSRWIVLRRGDLVTLELSGRRRAPDRLTRAPVVDQALVMQCERFSAHSHVVVLPVTRQRQAVPLLRIAIKSADRRALEVPKYVAIDQPRAILRRKVKAVFGRVDHHTLLNVDRAVVIFLGIAP